jgi:hypothetical protein
MVSRLRSAGEYLSPRPIFLVAQVSLGVPFLKRTRPTLRRKPPCQPCSSYSPMGSPPSINCFCFFETSSSPWSPWRRSSALSSTLHLLINAKLYATVYRACHCPNPSILPRALAGRRPPGPFPKHGTMAARLHERWKPCHSDCMALTPRQSYLFPVAGLVAHTAPSCFSCPLVLIGRRTDESAILRQT